MRETRNAQIESTFLGFEDHGIMTLFVRLRYDGGGQGFGGYAFSESHRDADGKSHVVGRAYNMNFLMRTLDAVGVRCLEDLKGKYVRVEHDSTKVYGIGHIIENKWFYPDQTPELHGEE